MYFKISTIKGVLCFGKKGKFIPCYMDPYEILQKVGKVSYELNLPSEFASVHPIFHVSMLKKFIGDPDSILPIEGLGVKDDLSYEKVLVQIFERQVKKLRNKEVVSVKVLRKKSSS